MTTLAQADPVPPSLVPPAGTKTLVNTRFLLFVGVVFVVNSHLESFYPWPSLAGDGLIGFAVFFFVSGLGLALSSKSRVRPFPEYYWRRVVRIYPTLWLSTIPIDIVTDLYFAPPQPQFLHLGGLEYVRRFIWPTANTFVGPLMVCYIILYIVLRLRPPRSILLLIGLLFVPVALCWGATHSYGRAISQQPLGVWLWWCANCQILLLGAWLGFHLPALRSLSPARFVIDAVAFVVVLGVYIPVKYIFNTGHYADFYPALFFFVVVLIWLLFRMACNPALDRFLGALGPVRGLVALLGACCLEAYFIQANLAGWQGLAAVRFPLNIVLLWVILLPSAYLVQRIASWLRSGCKRFSWRIEPVGH